MDYFPWTSGPGPLCKVNVNIFFTFSPHCILFSWAKTPHFAYIWKQRCKVHSVRYLADFKDAVHVCTFVDQPVFCVGVCTWFITHKSLVNRVLCQFNNLCLPLTCSRCEAGSATEKTDRTLQVFITAHCHKTVSDCNTHHCYISNSPTASSAVFIL